MADQTISGKGRGAAEWRKDLTLTSSSQLSKKKAEISA